MSFPYLHLHREWADAVVVLSVTRSHTGRDSRPPAHPIFLESFQILDALFFFVCFQQSLLLPLTISGIFYWYTCGVVDIGHRRTYPPTYLSSHPHLTEQAHAVKTRPLAQINEGYWEQRKAKAFNLYSIAYPHQPRLVTNTLNIQRRHGLQATMVYGGSGHLSSSATEAFYRL